MTRVFRLFLSSPGDVAVERRRVAAIVSRLNGECAGRARIDVIRWETEAYQAHQTFQAQIPQSVECDLVLTIFKWRLGTELPPGFPETLDGGEPYPSGTAYELLTSVEARRRGAETPDVFVYRYGGSAPRPAIDDPDRDRVEREWNRLEAFFARWFLTPEGHFRAAFQLYADEDDFEAQVEGLLRRWLTDKVAAGRILAWPDAIKGSPFPGLESYGFRHAAVFFGRARDVARATELWRESAAGGLPFVLVVGASGSGKSSLVKAGLAPRITTPGVIEGVDHWRIAAFRPADDADGPLAALAGALLASERDLPAAEEGRGSALPELARDVGGPAGLAALLGADPTRAAAQVIEALDRLGATEQAAEHRGRAVRVDLALVVDQLDELFAPTLAEAQRDAFVAALAALLATGRVWVAATLRADLYAAMLAHPGLKALKEAGASYDLAPPGAAELAEIVRRPAEAADLVFGTDPATGEGVDERLLREAERPDMLPLVQLALARLYEGRRQESDEAGRERSVLPFEVYAGLGGLTGIVDEVGERALADLDEASIRALPRLVRSLAQLEQDGALAGTLTLTPRPFDEIAPDPPRRRLVGALVASRLLTVADTGDGSLVRLAHQRILTDWARAREIVQGSADFYRIRGEIEARRQRWQDTRRGDLLLPRGLPLAEAEDVVSRYGDEMTPETRAYVRASRARAGRAMMLTAAAAIVFALVAIGALVQWSVAREQTALALRNFGTAREAVRGVIFDIVQNLSDVAGMRIESLRQILTTVRKRADELAKAAPEDEAVQRTRAAMFDNFARLYARIGDLPSARENADEAVALMRQRLAAHPEGADVLGDLAVVLATRGDIDQQAGQLSAATRLYDEALACARRGAAGTGADAVTRGRVMLVLDRLGDVRLKLGDYSGSLAAYREQVALVRREITENPKSGEQRLGLSTALFSLGYLGLESGDLALAAQAYDESFALARDLARDFPTSIAMQRNLSAMLVNMGHLARARGQVAEAGGYYAEAVAIERRLLREDPGNGERERTLAIGLEALGGGAYAASDWPAALKAYEEALAIFRKRVAANSFDSRNRRSVMVALGEVVWTKGAAGDHAGADAAGEERLRLARQLAAEQPENAEARTDLAITLRDLAETKEALGDPVAGLALRREALALARVLAAIDPRNAKPLELLAQMLRALAQRQVAAADADGVIASFVEEEGVLRRMLALRPGDGKLRERLATALHQIGVYRLVKQDLAGSDEAFAASAAVLREMMEAGDARGAVVLDAALLHRAALAEKLGESARALAASRELVELRRRAFAGEASAARRLALATALVQVARLSGDKQAAREGLSLLEGADDDAQGSDGAGVRRDAEAVLAKP